MDVVLQRHCAKYIYAIPDGLRELMSDISREVLRSQPEDMYTFIADYLDALMITRENARVAAKTVENITAIGITVVELLQETGMSREEVDNLSLTVQTAFKRYVTEQEEHRLETDYEIIQETDLVTEIIEEAKVRVEDTDAAAAIIQKAYRMFKRSQEQAKDLLSGMVDWRIAARSTIRLYRKTDVSYEDANRAATLIKAAYKGYYTRRTMNRLLAKGKEIIDFPEEEHGSENELTTLEEEEEEGEEAKEEVEGEGEGGEHISGFSGVPTGNADSRTEEEDEEQISPDQFSSEVTAEIPSVETEISQSTGVDTENDESELTDAETEVVSSNFIEEVYESDADEYAG
ncbi:apolipoprotein B receptor isoform X2 [Photinus pyralis]|uniref:apolipoprotein B receptor isoform X2 n=1 Tax=Photinus pyralis TaxID=7054 RepID=UPI0012675C85|nr:apolipoprotein B receptor isoform X2 [Photinus pyralis]